MKLATAKQELRRLPPRLNSYHVLAVMPVQLLLKQSAMRGDRGLLKSCYISGRI